ncbi:tetratricopeptide repeat-containing sensor histidine kinase [Taibaiella koreensis]|uniref:tetratricopeptide repeat-containing sensor histidine kinase n=1 Tax=Taibaiella koreensis TaxID=1268548 RepID=UPI000E59C897|nr:ATP-binding protein [Taibaiella koreensis]
MFRIDRCNIPAALWRAWRGTCLLLVCLLIMSQEVPAQETRGRLHTRITATDSANISSLINKANAFQGSDPDSTIFYARIALSKSLALNYAFGSGLSLANMATAYRNKGAHARSLALYREALTVIAQQEQDREYYLAATYNAMFGVFFHLGMFDSAALNCYKVITLYENAAPGSINPRGSLVDPLIDAQQYLGICWLQTGYPERSLVYIGKAEQLSRQNKHQYQLLSILTNKSSTYCRLQVPEKAIAAATEALQLADRNKDHSFDYMLHINIAAALLQQNRNDSAIALLRNYLPAKADPGEAIDAAFVLGDAYYRQGQYHEAIAILLPAIRAARQAEQRYNLTTPYQVVAAAYAALGDHNAAYQALSTKELLEDTLTHKATEVMNMMDAALQSAGKDRKLSQNQVRINRQQHRLEQQYLWITAISAGGLMLALLLLLLYRNARNKRLRQEKQLQLMSKEQEVQQLKAIMKGEEQERARFARELHDGFVSQLSAIRMNFAAMDHTHPSPEQYGENLSQLDETIKELRKTAHNLMPEILLNAGLSEATQLYCDRLNQSHALYIDFRSYGYLPKLEPAFELPLYRMIQEAIQNIIKHSEADQAIVQFNYDKGILGITIEDNGKGFDRPAERSTGAGLYNFRTRVESLGGQFHYSSAPNEGTTLYFEFDLSTHEQ